MGPSLEILSQEGDGQKTTNQATSRNKTHFKMERERERENEELINKKKKKM